MPDAEEMLARAVVEEGWSRWLAGCRDRVGPFVDRHFSVRGSLALHRVALGWDIARAPANLFLAGPQFGLHVVALAAGRLGATRIADRLHGRSLLFRTRVAREMEWLVATELLGLPFRQGTRVGTRDALAETILADPRLTELLLPRLAAIGGHAAEPGFRERLETMLGQYAGTRAAASEVTTSLMTLAAGAVTLNKLTPGAVALGPVLAGAFAQQAAISAFPLGAGLGSLWYGAFPVVPSAGLVAAMTGGLMLAVSALAAFAGVVADPVQRRLGLHQRRLLRLIDAIERQARDPASATFAARDHYVARLMDLFDLIGAASRLVH